MIKVAIADDHHLVRQGIRALLEKAPDMMIVGEASDGFEAVELVRQQPPDVMVMDIVMPRMNGTQALERIRAAARQTQVVILSMVSDDTLVRQVMRLGARGYLLKSAVAEELLLAVRAASRRELFISPSLSVDLPARSTAQGSAHPPDPFDTLTRREREVLQLIAEGNTNQSMARILDISEKTVEKHRASLLSKLDVHDVIGLVRVAVKHHLISLDD